MKTHFPKLFARLFALAATAAICLTACKPLTGSERATSGSGKPAVLKWGPQETVAGKGFNVQPDGSSAMWMIVQSVNRNTNNYVTFGDQRITALTHKEDTGSISFLVPPEAYAAAGEKKIALYDASSGQTIEAGIFQVKPPRSE